MVHPSCSLSPLSSLSSLSVSLSMVKQESERVLPSDVVTKKMVVDPAKCFYYRWLLIITFAVLYNVLMIIGRTVFWKLNNAHSYLWFAIDYICDLLYIIDMIVNSRTGNYAS